MSAPGRVYGIPMMLTVGESIESFVVWRWRSHCRLCGWSTTKRRQQQALIIMRAHLKHYCNGRMD